MKLRLLTLLVLFAVSAAAWVFRGFWWEALLARLGILEEHTDLIQAVESLISILVMACTGLWTFLGWLLWLKPRDQGRPELDPLRRIKPEAIQDRLGKWGGQVRWINREASSTTDLRTHGFLLIEGRMKMGKTREAAELIRRAVDEDVISEDHCYEPAHAMRLLDAASLQKAVHQQLVPQSAALLFIDDLPRQFPDQSLGQLAAALGSFRESCKAFYVVATARVDQVSEELRRWVVQQQFHSIELPKLTEQQTNQLVRNAADALDLQVEDAARAEFVRTSDGTPQLPIMGLLRLKAEGLRRIGQEQAGRVVRESLIEAWAETRRYIEEQRPAARLLLEALGAFYAARTEARASLVLAYATWWRRQRRGWWRYPWWRGTALEAALDYLSRFDVIVQEEVIVCPDVVTEGIVEPRTARRRLGNFLDHHRRLLRYLGIGWLHPAAPWQMRALFDLGMEARAHGEDGSATRLFKLALDVSRLVTLPDRHRLRIGAFRALQDLTLCNEDAARELILDYLLPDCLKPSGDRPAEERATGSRYRECLADWLSQLPEPKRQGVRRRVLRRVRLRLQARDPRPACWLLARIGYRDGRVASGLWYLVEREQGALGSVALMTLASLGIQTDQLPRFEEEFARKAEHHYHRALASAARLAAEPSLGDLVCDWLDDASFQMSSIDTSIALGAISAILDANPEYDSLQGHIWDRLTKVAATDPALVRRMAVSSLPRASNTASVVPTLLNWIADTLGTDGALSVHRYRLAQRLAECVRPGQLDGWDSPLQTGTAAALRQDACRDTGSRSGWLTQAGHAKTAAWNTLLSCGYSQTLEWFESGVAEEANGFMQRKIMERLSCFRLPSLPDEITEWITEPFDIAEANDKGQEHARRSAAIRVARSTASVESFSVLLTTGLVHAGKSMRVSGNALADVALRLADQGRESIVDELVSSVATGQEHQSTAAAYAIKQVAKRHPRLVGSQMSHLVPFILDENRPFYDRTLLLDTLTYLDSRWIPDSLWETLRDWARLPTTWLGTSSLTVLAWHDRLVGDHDLLRESLGLRQSGGNWDLDPSANRFAWGPYVIGVLYIRHPGVFGPAVASLIRSLDWLAVPQAYRTLRQSVELPDRSVIDTDIETALLSRARRSQRRGRSETRIFGLLAELAPSALAQESWEELWDGWMSDSRAALADALGKAALETDSIERAVFLLQQLALDTHYHVRRSAYRALAEQSMEDLFDLCWSWSKLPSIKARSRAAEACGWLECRMDVQGNDAIDELCNRMAVDPEKPVRDAATRARNERRHRQWADQYLSVVLGVTGESNREILDAWCYGQALAAVGDETTLDSLARHLDDETRPPHVRQWIRRIWEQTKDKWDKKTQTWPDPWLAWRSVTLVKGSGTLRIAGENPIPIRYRIWSDPRPAPSTPPRDTWGGIIWVPSVPVHPDAEAAQLKLSSDRQGNILIKKTVLESTSGTRLHFRGIDHYPTGAGGSE